MSRSVKPDVFAGDNLVVDTVVVSRLRLYAVSDDCFYECDRVFRCRTQRYDFKNVRVPAEKIRVLFVKGSHYVFNGLRAFFRNADVRTFDMRAQNFRARRRQFSQFFKGFVKRGKRGCDKGRKVCPDTV